MSFAARSTFASHRSRSRPAATASRRAQTLTPIAAAILALASGWTLPAAQAQTSVKGAWFAAKGAVQRNVQGQSGPVPGASNGLLHDAARQHAEARQQLARSVQNLGRTASAIAAQQAAQKAAREAAAKAAGGVPDGHVEGGLWDRDAQGNLHVWTGAERPVHSQQGGKHHVAIKQTESKAVLNWETFNVGRHTTVEFQQQSSDAVLNRVVGAGVAPSQIQGAVKGDGTVMVVNQNGVVFTGSSQVNVRNLVVAAAKISDSQFEGGLYGANANTATFTEAAGKVLAEAGAQIATHGPANSTTGGGYVLLAGKQVENAGTIHTPNGQTVLAAGDSFIIKKGQGTEGNQQSTTRGNEVTVTGQGTARNTGLIQSPLGDMTLTANQVEQAGVLVSSTSVNQRGTIHLTAANTATDEAGQTMLGQVKLGQDSVTAILVDASDATAYDSQRDSLQAPVVDTTDNPIVPADIYRRDLSLVRIASSGTVDFERDSLTLATGGQVAVDAAQRALVRDGAKIDVAGAVGVSVAMESNSVKLNIQGNEMRDAPVNRDSDPGNSRSQLSSTDVWVDVRDLVYVPAGTNGYESDRWYTAGGLLEVGGYLGTQGHTAGEWFAQGGVVSFTGNEVVTQSGSQINLSGGTREVQDGYLRQSWLRGADGRLYRVDTAPGDILYTGLYKGYEQTSERWGHTRYFHNPIIAPGRRWEAGYTVGRDAGTLVIGTKHAVLEGDVVGDTYQGARQTQAAQAGLDGYYQSQRAVARGANLVVGHYVPYYVKDSGTLQYRLTADANTIQDVMLNSTTEQIAAALDLDTELPEERQGTLYLNTDQLNSFALGGLKIAAGNRITVDDAITVGHGGDIVLYGPAVSVNADVTAHGGSIHLGNVLYQVGGFQGRFEDTTLSAPTGTTASVAVAEGVKIDASGLWSNLWLDPDNIANLPYQHGGGVSIRSTGDVTLGADSLIDVTSGAALHADGGVTGGRGGSVRLQAGALRAGGGLLAMDGDIRGHGVNGGGILRIETGSTVVIGEQSPLEHEGFLDAGEAAPISLVLDEPYTVLAGELLPTPVSMDETRDYVVGGQVLTSQIRLITGTGLSIPVGEGGWDLRGTSLVVWVGDTRYRGLLSQTVPEGAVIDRIDVGTLPINYKIPDSVARLPTQAYTYTITYAAGEPAPMDVSIAAGTVLPTGAVLSRRAAVQALLMMEPDFFDKGFANYEVVGAHGLLVTDGARVDVTMPVYRFGGQAVDTITGETPEQALELWTPPLYQEDPLNRVLTQRKGAGLTLQAGNELSTSNRGSTELKVGEGASIRVDPGQSIDLYSNGQLTVLGTLQAWGGEITLRDIDITAAGEVAGSGRSIWIGENAVLDVAARAATAVDNYGNTYGFVAGGGNIVVGGWLDEKAGHTTDGQYDPVLGETDASDLFVVIRPGARLDASGASAMLDVPGLGAVEVASDGGSIALASNNGLYLDGALLAESGGAGAAGGRLTVALETPMYAERTVIEAVRRRRELVLSQEQPESALADGVTAADAARELLYGHGALGVDTVEAGGFDTLALYSNGLLNFDGDVSLAMGYALNLYAPTMALSETAQAVGRIELAAPYVRLAGVTALGARDLHVRPAPGPGPSSVQEPTGSLVVRADRLLELRDSFRGEFDNAELSSQGDLRFLRALNTLSSGTRLYVPGDLTLTAAQIYPATGASAWVYAGNGANPDRTLTIGRTATDGDLALPYTVFGSLSLSAARIEQGGVVRAPLGVITLGEQGTDAVELLPGSITSVSASGLVMPYGGTVDGQSYLYAGNEVGFIGVGGANGNNITQGIELAGNRISIQEGALVDLSGGGELTGAGFVSGRGGSTDARFHPLVQVGADGTFTLPELGSNPVYAIVPGIQPGQAPVAPEGGAVDPMLGQQITIGDGVPGLPAGTYTLLPSTYALLPGAFRLELNGLAGAGAAAAAALMRNGSYAASGLLSIAGTSARDSLASQVVLTPADVLRAYSQYNETSYADFAQADAARRGLLRPMLPSDAKTLRLMFGLDNGEEARSAFTMDGVVDFSPAEGGYGGQAIVLSEAGFDDIEIVGGESTPGFTGISIQADALSALKAPRLAVGTTPYVLYEQERGRIVSFRTSYRSSIYLRDGVDLSAGEVMLVTEQGVIDIASGASIHTIGQGATSYDSSDGLVYDLTNTGYGNRSFSMVAVSNGWLQVLAPDKASGDVRVGGCAVSPCAQATEVYSEGTIVFATGGSLELGDDVNYGTENLLLAVRAVNVGSAQALADAAGRGALPHGLTLDQNVLDRLLQGDTAHSAPALRFLTLTAADSVNFYGTTGLTTIDPATGEATLENFVLNTPAIYGYGEAGDVATIETSHFIWQGATQAPGAVVADGAGTGVGSLDVLTDRITFGYGPYAQTNDDDSFDRMTLGFAEVSLHASERISANNRGSLAVYQSQDGKVEEGEGWRYSGGNLNLVTPLLMGDAGSVNHITAGGRIDVSAPAGAEAADLSASTDALGAELSLNAGRGLVVDTLVMLPSGRLSLSAQDDVVLADGAHLHLAGRTITFFDDEDATRYSWGGDVILESLSGDIVQQAGAVIDLSAEYNNAGSLTAVALAEAAGRIDLAGQILGSASGYYNAGGTLVPYRGAGVDIRAQALGDGGALTEQFAALNARLNEGEVFGARSFQLKQGDLTIGDELKAGEVNVSLDNGHLTVSGFIDASGERAGSIRLAGRHGLTIGSNAVLDAHGTVLRVDSYGKIIDAPNRAIVELNSGDGLLTLAQGARIDLRHGTDAELGAGPGQHDGAHRGTLDLYAPRIGSDGAYDDADAATHGDVAIDASGTVDIVGARAIVLNANYRYDDAPVGTDELAGGGSYQVIDQKYLGGYKDERGNWVRGKHDDSKDFIDHALVNDGLMSGKLAGLNNAAYRDAFHLRPGVEIISNAEINPDGRLVVQDDVDLSGYRYASVNPHFQKTSVYGSGEPGALVIRAEGGLDIYGSINDGFAPPPDTAELEGTHWVLLAGVQPFGGDLIVPAAGVELAGGTKFPADRALNYDLPVQAFILPANTELPAQAVLDSALTLPANTVLRAAVRDADGTVLFAAGTVLSEAVTLLSGSRLDAGTLLPGTASLRAMTWPKGVPLPAEMMLADTLSLGIGALIPANTDVVLPDEAVSVPLRANPGRNWALAAMLDEGSLSWNMRLVAGASLQAADTRNTLPRAASHDVTLGDAHYRLLGEYTVRGGGYVYAPGSWAGIPGDPVPDWDLATCGGSPDQCVSVGGYVYAPSAWAGIPGDPVPDWNLSTCAWYADQCVAVGGENVLTGYFGLDAMPSVLRTGTGDLDVIASGAFRMYSPYGVYTAGSRSADLGNAYQQARGALGSDGSVLSPNGSELEHLVSGDEALYQAYYPEHGGNVLLQAGGDIISSNIGLGNQPWPHDRDQLPPTSAMGNWLWRQGTGGAQGVDDIPAAWWINFGTFALRPYDGLADTRTDLPYFVGFTGIGTLGGGNLAVAAGGKLGIQHRQGYGGNVPRSEALSLVVGGTGRVLDNGDLVLTGGGDLMLSVGGGINPERSARGYGSLNQIEKHDLNGVLVNLRGSVDVAAGSIGGIEQLYGWGANSQDWTEVRASDLYTSTRSVATGGLVLAPGDAVFNVNTRSDLAIGGVADPGRVNTQNTTPWAAADGAEYGGGQTWFSLWTDNTAINLFTAGGDLTPITVLETNVGYSSGIMTGRDTSPTDGAWMYPSTLTAVAPSGSLYYGPSGSNYGPTGEGRLNYGILLAPSSNADARLELLAGQSIFTSGFVISRSGAALSSVATPSRPAFVGRNNNGNVLADNLNGYQSAHQPSNSGNGYYPLIAFGPKTVSADSAIYAQPARFYAVDGDIVGASTGAVYAFLPAGVPVASGETWYLGATPVWMRAGRDIVSSGTLLGETYLIPGEIGGGGSGGYAGNFTTNLFVHNNATDVSLVKAGRDIIYSSFEVAGPGVLEITAGRHIRMEDQAAVRSLGPVLPGDNRPGASIVMQAGLGAQGANWSDFLDQYLDPTNQADVTSGLPLADQPGKVAKTYEEELIAWLAERYGFEPSGDEAAAEQALAYFRALPAEQQRIFARQVYFAELREGGREYNDADGPRFGSYLRGRNAIAALFPEHDEAGEAIVYQGDLLMYGGAGIHTNVGGDIQVLTPGGAQTFGVEGEAPPSTAGVVTLGQGNIQLYSLGSILLGQSRIMTTFGGDILAWSAEGDINAGRGSKTTLVYTPPRRVYDAWGNVTISPDVPSTGAGIATLDPIPEVPPGDVDLIAPLGTIDAGEAGIRVSGNVNVAALQVLNADNIEVKGESKGIPVMAAVNVGALTSASAAASSAATAAQETVARARAEARQNLPSIINVRILGFGNEAPQPGSSSSRPADQAASYRPDSLVQVVGRGDLTPAQAGRLTADERRHLGL